MAQYIVCYDLKATAIRPHPEVIIQAYAYGWSQWLSVENGQTFKLPNTTLVGYFDDIDAAKANFDAAVIDASRHLGFPVIVEKVTVIAAPSTLSASDEVR